jgi:hypothetical protein
MMQWPYQFLHLDPAGQHARRVVLDRYGLYAQLSPLLPIALFIAWQLCERFATKTKEEKVSYDAIPASPSAKPGRLRHRKGNSTASRFSRKTRQILWWLGTDVEFAGQSGGQRGQLIFGGLWTAWLMFLCVNETGNGTFDPTPDSSLPGQK